MSTPTTVNDRALNANDISVYISPQATKGALDSNPEWQYVRRNSGTIKEAVSYSQSSEIKDTQQGKQQIKGSSTYTAELPSDIYQQTKNFMVSAIHSEQEDNTITDIDIAATATGFTVPGNTLTVGDYIFLSGLADTDDNRAFYVSNVVGSSVTTAPAPASLESAGNSITVASKKAQSGKSRYYYGLQERRVDLSKAGDINCRTFSDAQINTFSFEVPVTEACSTSSSFVIEQKIPGSSLVVGQTDAARDQSDAVSADNHIKRFWIDGSDSLCEIKSMSLEVSNNLQEDRAAGCNRVGYEGRSFDASGSITVATMISDSGKWQSKYENGNRVNFAVEIEWTSDGKKMIVVIEQTALTEQDMPTETNAIATGTLSFACEESLANGKTISVYSNF